jgi:hypothetical protein
MKREPGLVNLKYAEKARIKRTNISDLCSSIALWVYRGLMEFG